MPRVVPSQVTSLLERTFPQVIKEPTRPDGIGAEYAPILRAIVELVRQIPSELIVLSGDDYADLVAAVGAIEYSIERWLARGATDTLAKPVRGKVTAIALLHQALKKCVDEAPAETTAELAFISDGDLRDSIRRDIAAADRDLANGSWKGATVLAAAAAEALLLWAIQEKSTDRLGNQRTPATDIQNAVDAAVKSGALSKKPSSDPEAWGLHEYIEVSKVLNLISEETAKLVRLAKDYRNLIHPGRSKRRLMACDRGTALTALAGAETVVRELGLG